MAGVNLHLRVHISSGPSPSVHTYILYMYIIIHVLMRESMLVFLYTYPNITCSASCSGQHTDGKQVLCSHDIFFLLKSAATASDQGKRILGCPKLFSTWYRLVMPRLCRGGGDVEYESPLVIQILAAFWWLLVALPPPLNKQTPFQPPPSITVFVQVQFIPVRSPPP